MENLSGENFSFHVDTLDDVTLQKLTVQWARYIMQLATLRFAKVGSLRRNEDGDVIVSRLLTPHTALLDKRSERLRGPFPSAADYLLSASAAKKERNWREGGPLAYGRYLRATLIDGFMCYLMDYSYNSGPFVLNHPDFGVGHILIDPQGGDITGVLDWDWAAVVPLQSHIYVADELNYEFLPSDEIDNEPGGRAENGWKLDFSKKYRQTFEEGLIAAAEGMGLDYRVDELLDRSLMFKMYERALQSSHDERYFPALWQHVYGEVVPYDRLRTGMKFAEWGRKAAQRHALGHPLRNSFAGCGTRAIANSEGSVQRKSVNFKVTDSQTFSEYVDGGLPLSDSVSEIGMFTRNNPCGTG